MPRYVSTARYWSQAALQQYITALVHVKFELLSEYAFHEAKPPELRYYLNK